MNIRNRALAAGAAVGVAILSATSLAAPASAHDAPKAGSTCAMSGTTEVVVGVKNAVPEKSLVVTGPTRFVYWTRKRFSSAVLGFSSIGTNESGPASPSRFGSFQS